MKQLLYTIGLCLVLVGCQTNVTNSGVENIKDTKTQESVPILSSKGYTEVEHLYDSMYLRNNEYAGTLVVDTAYFNKNKFQRGEVVYYSTPKTGHKNVARVVGLPGEKVEIKKGQLYIDDKRLDAFYAKAMNGGISDFTIYKKRMKENGNIIHDEKDSKAYFKRNLKPVDVKENEVFVLADNSWRAMDSFIVGPLPQEKVIGKVLGMRLIDKEYVKSHAKIGLTQSEVIEKFGPNYQSGSTADWENILMYDTTKKDFIYDHSLEVTAFKDIKQGNVVFQLFINFRGNNAIRYSYFFKGKNGEVWEYVISQDQKPQEIQVSTTIR